MAKNNRRFGPADRAVVITQLLAGATVAAAAKAAGFAVQTLYDDRKRCALFARAWADAVAESARPRLVEMGTGGWWTLKRLRRNRFTRARKQAFLAHLAVSADVHASAIASGVCTSTVYAHRQSDPAFAAAWVTALACGVAVLEARLVQQRIEAHEAFEIEAGELPPEVAARERDLEFWRSMHLLREHRRATGGGGWGGGAGAPEGRGRGQRPRIKTNAEVRAEVAKGLAAFERRCREEDGKRGTPPPV